MKTIMKYFRFFLSSFIMHFPIELCGHLKVFLVGQFYNFTVSDSVLSVWLLPSWQRQENGDTYNQYEIYAIFIAANGLLFSVLTFLARHLGRIKKVGDWGDWWECWSLDFGAQLKSCQFHNAVHISLGICRL